MVLLQSLCGTYEPPNQPQDNLGIKVLLLNKEINRSWTVDQNRSDESMKANKCLFVLYPTDKFLKYH